MRLQALKAGCGPAAVTNALVAMGKKADQEEIARRAGTTGDGTGAAGLRRALRWAGHESREVRMAHHAEQILFWELGKGNPVILCVDEWEHWVTAYAVSGSRIFVLDPADGNMVLSYTWEDLADRWAHEGKKYPYYGIVVERT